MTRKRKTNKKIRIWKVNHKQINWISMKKNQQHSTFLKVVRVQKMFPKPRIAVSRWAFAKTITNSFCSSIGSAYQLMHWFSSSLNFSNWFFIISPSAHAMKICSNDQSCKNITIDISIVSKTWLDFWTKWKREKKI